MKIKLFIVLLSIGVSHLLQAAEIAVDANDNIAAKLTEASENDTLVFEPGEYKLNLTLEKKVHLKGRSTKDTVFKALDNSLPILTVSNVKDVNVQNISFLDSYKAILVMESNQGLYLTIKNSVFNLQRALESESPTVAIDVGASDINIDNNVFYENNVAIRHEQEIIQINENIFMQNDFDVDSSLTSGIGNNCFNNSESTVADISGSVKNADPNFVDAEDYDFHLTEDSECLVIINGNLVVMGAYGGEGSDKIPAAVKVKNVDDDNIASGDVVVSWAPNLAREVDGYVVYYDTSPMQSFNTLEQRENLNLIRKNAVAGDDSDLSITISGLQSETTEPLAPTLISVEPRDKKLIVKWSAVEDADEYNIYYTGHETSPSVVSGNATSYEIKGLSNDTVYTVWITTKSQLQYYFQVVAETEANSDTEFQESFFIYEDYEIVPGSELESVISNKISQQPEAISAYPLLANEGCFIATAAFGYYSAEEVMVLRRFRDHYLLTNQWGTAFVNWYYTYGPYAADIVRQSDIFRSLVRLALYPFIIAAQLLEYSSLLFFGLISFYFFMLIKTVQITFELIKRRASNG